MVEMKSLRDPASNTATSPAKPERNPDILGPESQRYAEQSSHISTRETRRNNKPTPEPQYPHKPPIVRYPASTPTADPTATSSSSSTAAAERRCTLQLVEMGFPRDKAEPVAASVEGNLGLAIDVLDEDQKAWKSAGKRVVKAAAGGVGTGRGTFWRDPVPGSWDEELYG